MIISIHQPDYLTYLGYFYKVAQSDRFVFLDDCQFSNDNMHHWNRIKTPQGECRLKIPVEHHFGDPICKTRTKDELGWKEKHLKIIAMNYAKAPFFKEIFPVFEELLMQSYDNLADLNVSINTWIIKSFGFKAELYRSSEMPLESVREERVIDICKALDGDVYISGHGAKAYQVEEHFTDRGVKLVYTDYHPIEYPQRWNKQCGFLPYLSTLDYILNCGFEWEYVANAVKELNA